MAIQKTDFTPTEQALIQTWIDTDIPARITAYQESLVQLNASLAVIQPIDDIFKKIYDSWTSLHAFVETLSPTPLITPSGFLKEIRGLNGDYVTDVVDEVELETTAQNPVGSRLFPIGYTSLDPLYAFDLRAQASDLDGNSPTGTGYNEEAALTEEYNQWSYPPDPGTPPPPPPYQDDGVIRDMWDAEIAAQNTQIAAHDFLLANLTEYSAQDWYTRISTARTNAIARRNQVQLYKDNWINFSIMPVEGARMTEISSWLTTQVGPRITQVYADQATVRDERYFWVRMRINLAFGSLTRIASTDRAKDMITARIADLQAELLKYDAMGF